MDYTYDKQAEKQKESTIIGKVISINVIQAKKTKQQFRYAKLLTYAAGTEVFLDFNIDGINEALKNNKKEEVKQGDVIKLTGIIVEKPYLDENKKPVLTKQGEPITNRSIQRITSVKIIERGEDIVITVEGE